jgi:hypothetical protein
VPQAPLLGGLFIGVLSALPIVSAGNCCCLWIFGGGVLTAYLDQQQDPRPMTAGRGAYNGFLAGVIGAFVWLVVALALDAVLGPFRERALEEIVRVARDVPPEVRGALEAMRGRSGAALTLNFFFLLCAGAIFSTLGGVLGASFFRSDVPPALGGPPEPPAVPPQ